MKIVTGYAQLSFLKRPAFSKQALSWNGDNLPTMHVAAFIYEIKCIKGAKLLFIKVIKKYVLYYIKCKKFGGKNFGEISIISVINFGGIRKNCGG